MAKNLINTARDVSDLAKFLEEHGGVANTFPQSGSPLPGEGGASLMAQHLAQDGLALPVAQADQDFKALIKAAPEMKMG